MSADERFDTLLRLAPRYVIVRNLPPGDIGFKLMGHVSEPDQIDYWHTGIPNCKPGIWKAMAKDTPAELQKDLICWEVCLRWVGELTPDTELDFAGGLDEWEDWNRRMQEKFGDGDGENAGLVWMSGGGYFDDGGICNVISTSYLTEKAATEIIHGQEKDKEEEGEGAEEEDEFGFYLEAMTQGEDSSGEDLGLDTFCLGGLHFGQDTVGCPPQIAIGHQDGKTVVIKLFHSETGVEEGDTYQSQPGSTTF
ncbi:hypothetical protein GQ53DRAFT_847039 [Thozetella sp. PMI_491]|nr:hypothetical protein GQ53DRAFT_847039 [Thozetella sp. PMI_491]